jgi:hypothetical protein
MMPQGVPGFKFEMETGCNSKGGKLDGGSTVNKNQAGRAGPVQLKRPTVTRFHPAEHRAASLGQPLVHLVDLLNPSHAPVCIVMWALLLTFGANPGIVNFIGC